MSTPATAPPVPRRAAPGRCGRLLGLGPVRVRVDGRAVAVAAVLLVLVAAVAAVTLATGAFRVPLSEVLPALAGRGDPGEVFVVRTLRLPRLLTGLAVGAALAVGGALFQSVSRNPLGSPDIVGFTTGAATGALLVLLVGHGGATATSLGAVAGGVGTAAAVYLLALRRGTQGQRLVVVGIGIAAVLASVNSFLLTRARVADAQAAAVWLVGSLGDAGPRDAATVGVALAVLLPVAVRVSAALGLLELGDDTARGLGVSAERTRVLAAGVGVGLTAVAVAAAGPVAFVALAAPQITRRLTRLPGPNVAVSAVTGALLLAVADLAAQHLVPGAGLPVGVATGAVGGVYLAWLLARQWRRGRG